MKIFKRLMSFALAMLTMMSAIPISSTPARAAPSNAQMMDNYVLDSMEYLGFDMDGFKASGLMYTKAWDGTGEEGVEYAPDDIRYVSTGDAANGTETTADSTTVTGKAPYLTSFRYSGICCGSFVAYYTMNYLYNIKGENVKDFIDAMNTYKWGSYRAAMTWRKTLETVYANRPDVLDRVYYADYDAKENGKPKKPSAAEYDLWQVGDIITFGYADEDGNEHYSHVAIYLGPKNGLHWVAHSVPRTNSKGKDVTVLFGTVEMMYGITEGIGKNASVVTGVYRILKTDHYEKTGKIEVYKKDPNGKPLAGATFKATETTTGEVIYIGPTDEKNGYASKDQIPYGTYKIVETVFPEGYTTSGTKEWTKTLNENTPNATITINAVNKQITGTAKIVKKSTNGGTVKGWWFYIWDSNWKWVGKAKTDENGCISKDLAPGDYIIREVPLSQYAKEGLEVPKGVDPQYWTQDSKDKTVTITANSITTVTFDNKYYGNIQIKKSTNTGGNLAGWVFSIYKSNGDFVKSITTDSNGIATSGKLNPGTYYIKEVAAPFASDGWYLDVTTSGGVVCTNNLFFNSDFSSGTTRWVAAHAAKLSVTTVDGKQVMMVGYKAEGEQDKGYAVQAIKNTGAGKFTLSADVYVEQAQSVSLNVWDSSTGNWISKGSVSRSLNPGWNHIEHTFNLKDACTTLIVGFGGDKSSGGFYVYHPKFVCGDDATDWAADRTVTVNAGSTVSYNVKNALGSKIAVQKNTNTGEFLSGWVFEVRDSSGALVETLVTNSAGYAVVSKILAPGTYTVTEIGNNTPGFDPQYWDMDKNATRTVNVSADSYKEIYTEHYDNTHMGIGQIKKVTENGGTVEGWMFRVYYYNTESTASSKWEKVGDYATDKDGMISLTLRPGTYRFEELRFEEYGSYPLPEGVNPEYWKLDVSSSIQNLKAGETLLFKTYTNKLLGKVAVQKSTNTGGDLAGWIFEVKDSTGAVVATLTTGEDGKAVSGLLNPGSYTVTEVGGPEGLWGSADWFCDNSDTNGVVEVVANETVTHNVKNIKGGKIAVQKNTNTGNYLNGWLFEVKNAEGEIIATLETNELGYAETVTLEPGVYTVTEVGNSQSWYDPNHWILDSSEYAVEISADTYEEYKTVAFTNDEKGDGQIQKVVLNGGSVEGWEFKITDTDGNTVFEGETDENGLLDITLPEGTYHVYEVTFRDYYENDPAEYKVMEIVAGEIAEAVVFTNRFVSMIEITKETNTDTASDYDGWLFGIYTDADCTAENRIAELTTATIIDEVSGTVTGKASVFLDPGTYYIKEEGRADGSTTDENGYNWIMDTHVETVTIVGGETAAVTFRNEKYGKGQIIKETNTGNDLADWTFEIWRVTETENEYIGEYTTLEDGTVTVGLLPGEYIVKEKIPEVPDPYWVYDAEPRTVLIEAGKTAEIGPFINTQLGKGRIIKETNTGNNLGGWQFGVFTNAECTDDSLVLTVTSADEDNAESGAIYGQSEFYLEPGTYWVKETGYEEGRYDPEAWEVDPTIHEVVIVAGEEAIAVTFTNIITKGSVEIVKKATHGGTVIGWQFSIVGVDSEYSEIVTITEELDGVGFISKSLTAGEYIITEIGHSDPNFDMTYWELDSTPRTVKIEVEQTVAVEYTNKVMAGLTVKKTLSDPTSGTVEGWEFKIEKVKKDESDNYIVESTFTAKTDENGLISAIVDPGTYRITELLDEDSPWTVVGDNPKVIDVVAAKPNEVVFVNTLGVGEIRIDKVDGAHYKPLAGAEFLLEWSEDGKTWKPVVKSNTVVKGGCTSPNLVDGKLISGEDGVIVFSGLHPSVQYRVTETKAPGNYQKLSDYAYVGALPSDTLEVRITVVNNNGWGPPNTGIFGTTETFACMMLAFMTLAMFAFVALNLISNGKPVENNYKKGRKPMKKTRIFSLLLALCLTISMVVPAFAATAENATINPDALGSIELYKYDMTAATDGGVFQPDSFVSTGTPNEEAEFALRDYAIEGVVFSYHKIADITTYSVNEIDEGMHIVKNLYAMPEGDQTNDLLDAIGLTAGDAYRVEEGEEGYIYFTSDVLSYALRESLAANSSVVKDKLMQFNTTYNSSQFAETDEKGHTKVENLDLGLYIIVETFVPEQVKQTTAPFFVSVPSTSNDGTQWNYDLTFYPKNETDYPDLDKTVREDKNDTGKNDGTTDEIHDGYADTATGSDGDVMQYQIISSLPTITSDATNLTTYSFLDTLSKGIEYNKNDVKIEWFKTADCDAADLIATWTETDETKKFTVTYGTADNDATTMLIEMTDAGLAEINGSEAIYDDTSIYDGYSDCVIRITYAATVNSNADVVYGNGGNPNEVVLTWKRTNTEYFDTLKDCCHVYTYGIDLTKVFEGKEGNLENVNFLFKNSIDNYWIVAELDEEAGIYYVTGHTAEQSEATVFVPTEDGSIFVLGLEDDTYVITETQTDAGFVLLKDSIKVVISAANTGAVCDTCKVQQVVASATINDKAVDMIAHDDSANAVVTLTVVNNPGYGQPLTGDEGTVMLTVCGTMVVVSGVCLCLLALFAGKKKNEQQ